jgi:hypothetical protein
MVTALSAVGTSIATRLSRAPGHLARGSSLFSALARLSLSVALVSSLSGCLVDDPPPYPEPKQTPPRLDNVGALPPPDQTIVAKNDDLLRFTVPSASEDAGDGLNAFLYLDYNTSEETFLKFGSLLPSTLDDTSRAFDIPWRVRADLGCHRLTLRVAHAKNMPNPDVEVINVADLAAAYWVLNVVGDDVSAANTLVNCPQADHGSPKP